MSRRRVKILHTSDVHLESDTFGKSEEGQTYRWRIQVAFQKVVDKVFEENVDLFLIAGDLFDSNRVPREGVEFALREIARVPCPVVLIPGNHDCYDHRSIYKKFDFTTAGRHVHVLTGEDGRLLELPYLDTVIWGRPVIDHDRHFRPLAGIPARQKDGWHVAMGHGYFTDEDESLHRSSPISPQEIAASGWDYIALGHVHLFSDLTQGKVAASYAGTPAPLHLGNDSGGTVALVMLDPEAGVQISPRRIVLK